MTDICFDNALNYRFYVFRPLHLIMNNPLGRPEVFVLWRQLKRAGNIEWSDGNSNFPKPETVQ